MRGRNLYPQDLEHSAASAHLACIAGGAVAFTHDSLAGSGSEGEPLVLVQEVGAHEAGERPRHRRRHPPHPAEAHEVSASAVVLVARRRIARTSSGKVRRSTCRDAWAAGTLATLLETAWRATPARPRPRRCRRAIRSNRRVGRSGASCSGTSASACTTTSSRSAATR